MRIIIEIDDVPDRSPAVRVVPADGTAGEPISAGAAPADLMSSGGAVSVVDATSAGAAPAER